MQRTLLGAEWGLFGRRGGAGVQLDDVGVGAGPTELLAQSAGEVDAALEPGSGFLGQRHRRRGITHDFLEYFGAERISNGRALKSSSPWSRTARGAEVQPTAA